MVIYAEWCLRDEVGIKHQGGGWYIFFVLIIIYNYVHDLISIDYLRTSDIDCRLLPSCPNVPSRRVKSLNILGERKMVND